MADREQRTEEATPRKREKLREKGQVAKSQDVGAALALLGAAGALALVSSSLCQQLSMLTTRSLRLVDAHRPLAVIAGSLPVLMLTLAPIMVAGALAAIAGLAQSRTFSLSLVAFDPERLDPTERIKQVLPSGTTLLEIVKQVVKLGAIGWVAYLLIADATPKFSVLGSVSPQIAAVYVAGVAVRLFIRVGIAFAVVAAFDYWLAVRKFDKDAMMSHDEVKQERKDEEASPELRMRMRRMMRDLTKNRALADLSKATVLVTNPTHYAIALRYLPGEDFAPLIVAKGKDDLALQMRATARSVKLPIVENRPLARALWKDGKVGKPIPVELYRATAEVIAFVIQLGGNRAQLAPRTQGEA